MRGIGDAGTRTLAGMIIGLDGDDTLWHSERVFAETQVAYCSLLERYATPDRIAARLIATERRNIEVFGYGVKGFTLCMIETAIDLSGGRITGDEVGRIIEMGKELHNHPTELLDGVDDVVTELAADHQLVLVTKGDLFHQETKIAASGLSDHFWRIEIVSEKDVATYRRILQRQRSRPVSS